MLATCHLPFPYVNLACIVLQLQAVVKEYAFQQLMAKCVDAG